MQLILHLFIYTNTVHHKKNNEIKYNNIVYLYSNYKEKKCMIKNQAFNIKHMTGICVHCVHSIVV